MAPPLKWHTELVPSSPTPGCATSVTLCFHFSNPWAGIKAMIPMCPLYQTGNVIILLLPLLLLLLLLLLFCLPACSLTPCTLLNKKGLVLSSASQPTIDVGFPICLLHFLPFCSFNPSGWITSYVIFYCYSCSLGKSCLVAQWPIQQKLLNSQIAVHPFSLGSELSYCFATSPLLATTVVVQSLLSVAGPVAVDHCRVSTFRLRLLLISCLAIAPHVNNLPV